MDFSNMFKGIGDFFSVDSPVTSMSDMGSPDVIKTQNALADLGHFNTQVPDVGKGLKNFQAENGLKVDGIMNPGGETENALGQALGNQGLTGTDMLEKAKDALPDNITVSQPDSSKPDNRSWTASASFGDVPAKPKTTPKTKIDPMTGLEDSLAKSPISKKSKAEMDKLWAQMAEKQKPKTAILPQGNTVDERLRSMMAHPNYAKKKDPAVVKHIQDEFKRAYPGKLQYDETGKMIQPKSVIQANEVHAYDPNGELSGGSGNDVLYGGAGDDDLSGNTPQTQSAQDWDNENPERTWDVEGEKWQKAKEISLLEKRLSKELEDGNSKKVFKEIERLKAEKPEKLKLISDNLLKAQEDYAMHNYSSDIDHLYDPNNEKKAVRKGIATAAQPHTGQAMKNATVDLSVDAAKGGLRLGGADKETLEKVDKWNEKYQEENAIPEIYQGKTFAQPYKSLVKQIPVISELITAEEFGNAMSKAGFGKGASQMGAFAGFFSGKAGKVVAKAGKVGVDQIAQTAFGKKLDQLLPKEVIELKQALIEREVPNAMKRQIEGMLPKHRTSDADEEHLMP